MEIKLKVNLIKSFNNVKNINRRLLWPQQVPTWLLCKNKSLYWRLAIWSSKDFRKRFSLHVGKKWLEWVGNKISRRKAFKIEFFISPADKYRFSLSLNMFMMSDGRKRYSTAVKLKIFGGYNLRNQRKLKARNLVSDKVRGCSKYYDDVLAKINW